jgi:hypothetical protein
VRGYAFSGIWTPELLVLIFPPLIFPRPPALVRLDQLEAVDVISCTRPLDHHWIEKKNALCPLPADGHGAASTQKNLLLPDPLCEIKLSTNGPREFTNRKMGWRARARAPRRLRAEQRNLD